MATRAVTLTLQNDSDNNAYNDVNSDGKRIYNGNSSS